MCVFIKVVFCAALPLLLLKLTAKAIVTDDIPVQGREKPLTVERRESLQYLRAITGPADDSDPCLYLDPLHPDPALKAQADLVCQKAVCGFNSLVSNKETPAGWQNQCYLATEGRCRRIAKGYCRYRCSVKLPYEPPVVCWAAGQTLYKSLRKCAEGIVVPEN